MRNALMCSSLVAFFTIQIVLIYEEQCVFLSKHYEIPFAKEYALLFPLYNLVTNATGYIT